MSLTERIYGKETAGKPAVSSDTQKKLYTAAANKKPSLANRIAQNGGQPTLYADAAAKQKPSLASRIEANGGTPYADAAAQMKSGNAAKGTSVVFNSVYGKADDRASSAGSGKYAGILKASDYTELSKSGESKRKLFGDARYDYINNIGNFRAQSDVQQAQGRGQDYGKYAFMTDDEIGVYNYLYATQGKKAANAYLSDLEPELDKQWYTGTNRATTEALGKNAATRTLASAMTVAAQPARTITSMIAMADDAVRTAKGQEINPYSKWRQASNITQDLRADTSKHIEETNPGMGGKVGSFVYNTAMSAADSAMNALVAKGIGEAVGLTGDTLMKATNILGSALMSSEAASLSIAESKEKGYSNAGALALGLTRGAIEYASEAVGGEWVIRKIKANPLSFVKSMALTMIPEGMEEVMSDAANGVVNLAIDAAFGTEESGIPKMLEYYRTSGTDWQKKHAELATVLAVLGQEGLSFLGGALATLGSSSVQYSTNRANINQTAERLDTTPKNVVQMMQDAQTENPGVIYALAELTDAENADDLRQKIGTKEDMKRAAEYLTQQMEAGGRSGAREGTYTAGVQNAPVGAQKAQNEGNSTTPAAAINIQEGMNNGQSTYHREESGAAYVGSRGQAAEGAEGGLQALTGGRTEVQRGVGTDAQADLRQVTPAQLGIRNGGTEAVTVVDARKLGGEAKSAYDAVLENGLEPVAVRGAIQVGDGYANAYTESGRVFFRVDAVDSRGNAISPEMLVQHEMFHNYASEEVIRATDEVIRESMTAEEYDAMRDAYKADYAGVYDFANMSVDEIERLLTEEIAADAYAGLNWFSGDAPVQEAVRAETERNAPARRAEAQQETTGPPEGRGTIVVLPDGKKYVQADRQVIFGNDPNSWADQIEGYINRKIRNGEDVILTTDSGDVLKITKDTAGKASFRNYVTDENGHRRLMTDSEYEAKLNAEAHIDELIQVSEKKNNTPVPDELGTNGKLLHGGFAKNGWFYRKAWFQDFDGKYYLVTISTADGDNGVVVYNVGDMKRRGSPANKHGSSDSVTETGAQQGKSSSTVTIRQTEGNSQEKSSGKASVEVENRDSDNEKASFDAETAKEFIRSYTSLRRVVEERTKAYQNAIKADDPNYDYTTESKWISKAEQELRAGEAQFKEAQRVDRQARTEKKRPRSVKSTKRDIMQLFSTDRANRTDVERVLNRNIGEMMAQGEIRGDALDTLVNELLQTGSVVSSSKNSPWIDETYESIRSDLKGGKLYVSKDMWRDFSKDEARELRERARAAGITLSDNRRYTPPDVRNMELAEKYGEALFPTDISAPDMLRNIIYCAEQGANEKQTLADRLWDEAQQEGLGEAREHAYERMVNDLRDKTEIILREFAEDNHLKLKEQTKTKAKPVSYFDLKKAPAKEFDRKKGDYNIIGEIGSYTKEIAELENALETENRYVISEGDARYEARIEEENGVLYASVWKNGERLAGASSRKRKNLPNWAAMEIRKDVGARIMFHPGLENRGESYNADLKAAEEAGYPVFEKKNGEKVQTVPFWTWLKSKEYGNYGLVIDKTNAQDADGNPIVFAYYFNKKKGTGKVVMESRETAYVVDGKYSDPDAAEKRAARMKDEESEAMRAEEREALWRETQKGLPFEAQPNATTDTRERVTKATSAGVQRLFQQLISKGKTEVSTQGESGIRTYTAKMNTNGVEYWVDISDGRQDVQRFREFEKEKAAQLAAEWMDKEANRAYTAANEKRAEARRAELSAEENAKIAELFGNTEELKTAETPEDAPSPGETAESRVTDEIVKAEKSFRESLADVTHGAMRMFVNAGETVRRISKQTKNKSLEGYYFNAGAYSQRAGNWIAKGGARTDISGHKTGESLMDILGDIMKTPEKYKDFQLMLLHRNNVDRMRYDSTEEVQNLTKCVTTIEDLYPKLRGLDNDYLYQTAVPGDKRDMLSREWKETVLDELLNGEMPEIADISEAAQMLIFTRQKISEAKKNGLKPVFGYEVTAYDSQLEAERLLKANPEFDALAKRVYAYFDDLLQYRIDAGLDTQKHVDAMKKRYPNYVPTMRVEGTEGKTARRARRNGGIVVSNAIGRAVGGDAVIMPLHTAMSRKTVAVMKNAGLNQFGEQLVQSWNQDKSIPGVNKVDLVDYSSTDQYVDSEELYVPVTNNVFSVLRGNDRYNITMDEGLAQAMNAFQPDKYANSDIAKLLKKGNDLFKALCTGYNPIFMVRNLVRDAQDAAFYSTDSATWAKMFPSAWKQIVTNGEIWQQYKALGGSYASMLDYTTGMVKEPKSAAGKLAAKYESLGQAIEAAPRLAEFMTILANKGGSKTADGVKTGKFTQSDLMEAMLGAADITTNFARGGTVTKMLNKYLVPFLNPSVQGADKFVRNITDRKGFKAWASLAIKAAALGILPELLNGLLYRDDDEWDDIPDQTKSNYYLFKLGDGYWMKIPRGRALAVFSAGATYAQEKAKGNEPKFSDVIEVVKSNVAPTDIFNQNIATAWTQTKLFNPDNPGTTWYGGNIESDRLQNYRPGERYDEKTDELSKWIGKTFNLSPKKINYLLDQYSGVVGDLLLPWFTPSATASSPALAPLKQAFMLDSTSTNKTTGEYYDLLDDLKYDANDGDIGAGITRKYVSHAGDEVNDYYQQIRAIQSDENLTKAEKNRLVRALKAQLIERQKEIIAQAEPYREAVSDYLKAHPELSTDNDAAIAEYAEQYEITEDQAESRMDAIVYREANREVFGAEYALRTYNADVYDKARAAYAKGVSYETYYDYYFATKEMHADKDENGKSISGSKKAKVVEYINSLDIPPEQKDALYVAAGYTAKSARNQKWNGGSGGSGGRRGRGKRTALKAPTPKAPEIIIPKSGTASSAKAGGTSKTPKVSGNVIADFTKTASGTDIQKAVTQAKRKALKAGNRTVYVEEGSPIDYFLKYGKLPSLK
jgi:hypothetical protein